MTSNLQRLGLYWLSQSEEHCWFKYLPQYTTEIMMKHYLTQTEKTKISEQVTEVKLLRKQGTIYKFLKMSTSTTLSPLNVWSIYKPIVIIHMQFSHIIPHTSSFYPMIHVKALNSSIYLKRNYLPCQMYQQSENLLGQKPICRL